MITSLHSPHVEAVKALLGSRGNKERRTTGTYVVEGLSNIKELLLAEPASLRTLYITEDGARKFGANLPENSKIIEVSPEVMGAMSDTVTSQGVLAIADLPNRDFEGWISHKETPITVAYFWQIQDPGNAGTVIRAADAFGLDGVIFSDNSVDIYSPKVVRSTAGSLWHLPIFDEVPITTLLSICGERRATVYATHARADMLLSDAAESASSQSSVWVFGNEARGLPEEIQAMSDLIQVGIPMRGRAESLNLATAAAVVMYALAEKKK